MPSLRGERSSIEGTGTVMLGVPNTYLSSTARTGSEGGAGGAGMDRAEARTRGTFHVHLPLGLDRDAPHQSRNLHLWAVQASVARLRSRQRLLGADDGGAAAHGRRNGGNLCCVRPHLEHDGPHLVPSVHGARHDILLAEKLSITVT